MPRFGTNVRVTRDNRERILRELNRACERTLNEIGEAIVNHVRERVPVDTGALRDSYMADVLPEHDMLRVGSPLEYAP